jgi:hypothetical protein
MAILRTWLFFGLKDEYGMFYINPIMMLKIFLEQL